MKTILNLQTGRIQEVSDSVAETLVRTNRFTYVSAKSDLEIGWTTVDSSNLNAVKYDPSSKTLYIKFGQPIVNSMYEYYDVPEKVYKELMSAESKGSYCYHNISYSYNYKRIM